MKRCEIISQDAWTYPEVTAMNCITAAIAAATAEGRDCLWMWLNPQKWRKHLLVLQLPASTASWGRKTQTCICGSISSPALVALACLATSLNLKPAITSYHLHKSWHGHIQTAQLWLQGRAIPTQTSDVVRHRDQDGRVEEVEMGVSKMNTVKKDW